MYGNIVVKVDRESSHVLDVQKSSLTYSRQDMHLLSDSAFCTGFSRLEVPEPALAGWDIP